MVILDEWGQGNGGHEVRWRWLKEQPSVSLGWIVEWAKNHARGYTWKGPALWAETQEASGHTSQVSIMWKQMMGGFRGHGQNRRCCLACQ